ncbi:MAG: T9SS type A sorting domain-containing protein [Bacteroidales bacterium]|nr:T9SS type A sorting domain-containing protein [Bacteroidales bacterium]
MRGLIITCFCIGIICANAQQKSFTPQTGKKPVAFCKTPPLRTIVPILEDQYDVNPLQEAHSQKPATDQSVVQNRIEFNDPVIQDQAGGLTSPPLIQNFDGLGPMDNTCTNPDTEGDVGPNHYLQMVKRSFAIWDKEGNLLYGPANNKTLWSTLPGPWHDHWFTDPIVVYDHLADRWLASNMVYEIQTEYVYWEVIAISATPDPLGEWYCYAFEFDYMPDYPKFGVWNNEYVMVINDFDIYQGSATFLGAEIWAFNKQDMINGSPEPGIITFFVESTENNFNLSQNCFLPADIDGPPAPQGSPNFLTYIKDDTWGFDNDHLSLWQLSVDWNNPGNSSFYELASIEVEPFVTNINNFYFINQPNTSNGLFTMTNRLMYRLQYRNFGTYEAMVTNHTVTPDAIDHAGIRWYELRNYGEGWIVYQQGTYNPDSEHRWMGSISMDNRNNIALGYSVSSSQVYPSIRMSGRFDTDTAGTMNLQEIEVVTGSGSQTSNWRWGDYSCMSIDPSDDQTFWYTQMYMPTTGTLEWETKICSFKIAKELTFNTDTLFFNTIEECLNGKSLFLKNNSWDSITINDIEQEGFIMNAMWHVDEMPVSLPYDLPVYDSVNLLVKVDFTVDKEINGFVYDTLTITANSTYKYDIIIAINEEFITGNSYKTISDYNLSVYPNPFTDHTNISFHLDKSSKVSIEIIDQQLKKISNILLRKKVKKGDHLYNWDRKNNNGHKVLSGIYYCRITVDNKAMVIKMVIK